jgi:hypothetical protein
LRRRFNGGNRSHYQRSPYHSVCLPGRFVHPVRWRLGQQPCRDQTAEAREGDPGLPGAALWPPDPQAEDHPRRRRRQARSRRQRQSRVRAGQGCHGIYLLGLQGYSSYGQSDRRALSSPQGGKPLLRSRQNQQELAKKVRFWCSYSSAGLSRHSVPPRQMRIFTFH